MQAQQLFALVIAGLALTGCTATSPAQVAPAGFSTQSLIKSPVSAQKPVTVSVTHEDTWDQRTLTVTHEDTWNQLAVRSTSVTHTTDWRDTRGGVTHEDTWDQQRLISVTHEDTWANQSLSLTVMPGDNVKSVMPGDNLKSVMPGDNLKSVMPGDNGGILKK